MAETNLKKAVYEQLARIGKAMASPPRLELLDLLCQGPRTVEALAREAALTVATSIPAAFWNGSGRRLPSCRWMPSAVSTLKMCGAR